MFLAETLKIVLENQFASSSSRTKSHRTFKQNRWAVSYMRGDAVVEPRRSCYALARGRSATTPTSRAVKGYPFGVHLGFPNTGISSGSFRTRGHEHRRPRHRKLPSQRELPLRSNNSSKLIPGSRLVGSLVLLASRLSGGDGHGYCTSIVACTITKPVTLRTNLITTDWRELTKGWLR